MHEKHVQDFNQKDLDKDWSSSSDKMKNSDFYSVIAAHDFQLVVFFADWCSHCKNFAPKWDEMSKQISDGKMKFTTENGNQAPVHFFKVNCVDFQDTCQKESIRGYPQMRLYYQDKTYVDFSGVRTQSNVITFLKDAVSKKKAFNHHAIFSEGCRVYGMYTVPRAPGQLHFEVGEKMKKNQLKCYDFQRNFVQKSICVSSTKFVFVLD